MTCEWWDQAACRDEDQDAFFPLHPESFAAARGKSICAGCPVLFECANWAADHPDLTPHGTWGGMTEWERFPRRRKPEASNEAKNRRRKVAAMRSRGVTISVIARELDVSIALVQKDIVRLKMTTQQKKHIIDDAEVARLIELGWSQREIARKMGVDTKTIWRSLQRVSA
jgi:WhiB family redox-sensing transcriptional regulator